MRKFKTLLAMPDSMKNYAYSSTRRMKHSVLLIAGLLVAHSASADLSFSVDAVTLNSITITVTDGTALGGPVPRSGNLLLILDSISNADFVSQTDTFSGLGVGSLGGHDVRSNLAALAIIDDDDLIGDYLRIYFDPSSVLEPGDVALGITNTFTSDDLNFGALLGDLNPLDVGADLRLSWGYDDETGTTNLGTVQAVGAVPEPATYALLLGVITMGIAVARRRRLS